MLTQILTQLLAHPAAKDHELQGGLWLNWRPPDRLIISRKGVPPSLNELTIVERHLKAMSYTTYTRKLTKKTNDKGEEWFGWPIQITQQDQLL